MFIESYEDCMARFDKKLKRNYRFVVNPWKEIVMTEQAVQRLLEKVEDNIRSRELQGINQDTTRALLQALHDANEADSVDVCRLLSASSGPLAACCRQLLTGWWWTAWCPLR